jgi:cytochrome c peroxidase
MLKKAMAIAVLFLVGSASMVVGQEGILTPMEQLGKFLYFDKISSPSSMSCADCHAPSVGFTGPVPGINLHGAVYRGAVPQRFGNRKPPSAAYATLAPIFHYDETEGLFIGGNFWDGRATGERLGNPAAEQALGPFLNPVEQNMPSREAVLEVVAASKYVWLWEEVWGEPLSLDTPANVAMNYDRVGLAIAAYEGSSEVNQFSSKFDYFWRAAVDDGMDPAAITMMNWESYLGYGLAPQEVEGLALFNDESKGMCALCHVLTSPEGAPGMPPLFTDYSFDNLGTPKNPENPFYRMDEVYLDDGSPINPDGESWIDPGLGGFLASRPEWAAMAAENWGKHKVPTLRNVAKGPSAVFPKAFMHNGVFKTLKDVVHFYNTRDVGVWPPPEVADNVNTDELGDLGLTGAEEDLIVLFMETLSDGYKPKGSPKDDVVTVRIDGPNPFNPTTAIAYHVPAAGLVQLSAFDVSGKKVATLVDGWREAGDHRVDFVASHLSSGVYFMRLSTGGRVATTKAILVR